MQYLLGHLAVRIHRDDQGACFYPSALAVFIDRAAWMTVPRRAAASFNNVIAPVHSGAFCIQAQAHTGDMLRRKPSTSVAFSGTAHGHQVTPMPVLLPHTRTKARTAAHASAFPRGTHARA